jgi:hypothetical protein
VTSTPLAADPGFSLKNPYPLGQLFVGLAMFAAVSALSQQHELGARLGPLLLAEGSRSPYAPHFALAAR